MDEKKILQSWKEIASYLGRAERTCRRWEKEFGLPVHRMDGSHRTSVFAYKQELDSWLDRLLHEKKISSKKSFLLSKKIWVSVLSISILLVSILTVVTWKIFSPKPGVSSLSGKPSLAILHFSNNTKLPFGTNHQIRLSLHAWKRAVFKVVVPFKALLIFL